MSIKPRRVVVAAALAALAAVSLSACNTNVGTAAVIDGHRVSESDVSSYLTSEAKPVAIGQGNTPPRVFVLDVLILEPYFRKVIDASSIGNVSDSKLAAVHHEQLNGRSDASVAAQIGVHGYTKRFDTMVVDLSILAEARSQLQKNHTLAAVEKKVSFPVHLNPRYGTWSRNNSVSLFIDSSSSSGLPDFLKLQPAAGS